MSTTPAPLGIGSSGTLLAQMTLNGTPTELPEGEKWTWNSDPGITITPVPSDPTNATVTVTIPANFSGNTAVPGQITITATATDPNGAPVTITFPVPYTQADTYGAIVGQVPPGQ